MNTPASRRQSEPNTETMVSKQETDGTRACLRITPSYLTSAIFTAFLFAGTFLPLAKAGLDQVPLSTKTPIYAWKVGSYNPPVTPSVLGGSGTGALEICWVNYTNWAPMHAFTPPNTGTYQFWVRKLGDQTYNPTSPQGPYELKVSQPTLSSLAISFTKPDGTTTTAPHVGDKVTITSTAFDPNAQIATNGIRVYNPGLPPLTQGSWSDSGGWKVQFQGATDPTPLLRGFTWDYFFDALHAEYDTSHSTKSATFTLDAPGIWKFKSGIKDRRYAYEYGWYGPGTSDVLQTIETSVSVAPLELTAPPTFSYPIASASGTRLVGAYFNAGQVHRPAQELWQPWPDVWSLKWGPNPVSPQLYDVSGSSISVVTPYYLADSGGATPPSSQHIDNAKRIGFEMMYSGVDFIAIDHTNLVFTQESFGYNNTDQNPVIKAAIALKSGLATAASGSANRVKMTFLLGMTTAWYHPDMDFRNPALEIKNCANFAGNPVALSNFVNGPSRMGAFNLLLQYLWTNFADPVANPGVWQLDPTNGNKPLLLFYVGTNGPTFDRDAVNIRLESSRLTNVSPYPGNGGMQQPMTINVGGLTKSVSELFSIRWVGAFLEHYASAETTTVPASVALRSGQSMNNVRVFNKDHWQFRQLSRDAMSPMTSGAINGLGQATVQAVHSVPYRMFGEYQFLADIQRAIDYSSPSFLMLTAWNEFGSAGDEFSPEESWTLMPNSKYGRRYSDLVRNRVISFKSAP